MAEIRHLENRHDVIFFCRGWSDLDEISQIGAEWHVDCGDMVEIETRCRILIWGTFGRIQWHVILEPRITLQGAATWRIHYHDSRATCTLQGVKIPCAILKIIFRHILLFLFFKMQFGIWRVAAFVSSPIHLFKQPSKLANTTCKLVIWTEWIKRFEFFSSCFLCSFAAVLVPCRNGNMRLHLSRSLST